MYQLRNPEPDYESLYLKQRDEFLKLEAEIKKLKEQNRALRYKLKPWIKGE